MSEPATLAASAATIAREDIIKIIVVATAEENPLPWIAVCRSLDPVRIPSSPHESTPFWTKKSDGMLRDRYPSRDNEQGKKEDLVNEKVESEIVDSV